MSICCAAGCRSRRDSGEKISFHRFPKNPQLRKVWILALRRKDWTPYNTSVICSKHFEKKYYNKLEDKILLTPNAVPTLFPTHKAICEKRVCPPDMHVNTRIEGSISKTTGYEKSLYAVGFKMPENPIASSQNFHTENAECTVRNTEETENAVGFKMPENIIDSSENLHTDMAKFTVRNIEETENTSSSTEKPPTIVYTVTGNEPEESFEQLKSKLNTIAAETKKHRNELRTLQQKSRRLGKQIAEMEKFIYSYKENNWISDASLQILKTIPKLDNELLALHLCFQQSHALEEYLTDAISSGNFSDLMNGAEPIYISD